MGPCISFFCIYMSIYTVIVHVTFRQPFLENTVSLQTSWSSGSYNLLPLLQPCSLSPRNKNYAIDLPVGASSSQSLGPCIVTSCGFIIVYFGNFLCLGSLYCCFLTYEIVEMVYFHPVVIAQDSTHLCYSTPADFATSIPILSSLTIFVIM